ncbi:hypothetical protein HLB44_20695 [Aquincola sp. S2]|uniref:Uncharacterized protein n=1 Tax=Pseudaquabacterium terrae TaxID=2732868 RepID=A0ABX2ELA4_9BURK|nr:hypothetical protein [Aquabacterium terrae]NRF69423.1 hypothetical protein [Aquabacterium terrae]
MPFNIIIGPSTQTISEPLLDNIRSSGGRATKPAEEAQWLDGAARYLGEVLRQRTASKWSIRLSDPKMLFVQQLQWVGLGADSGFAFKKAWSDDNTQGHSERP